MKETQVLQRSPQGPVNKQRFFYNQRLDEKLHSLLPPASDRSLSLWYSTFWTVINRNSGKFGPVMAFHSQDS